MAVNMEKQNLAVLQKYVFILASTLAVSPLDKGKYSWFSSKIQKKKKNSLESYSILMF